MPITHCMQSFLDRASCLSRSIYGAATLHRFGEERCLDGQARGQIYCNEAFPGHTLTYEQACSFRWDQISDKPVLRKRFSFAVPPDNHLVRQFLTKSSL